MNRLIVLVAALLSAAGTLGQSSAQARERCDRPRYAGTWCSETNGHNGKLHARVRQTDECTYKVRYCGTFLKVVPFMYSAPMTVTGQGPNGEVYLTNTSRLPLFGEFTSNAVMTENEFVATYSAASDKGQFVMQGR